LLANWARIDVLLIDDFLIRPLGPDQAADVLEAIEDRVQLRATIVTSQLPVALWHEALGEPTVADGILDRLLENVHRVELHGEPTTPRTPTHRRPWSRQRTLQPRLASRSAREQGDRRSPRQSNRCVDPCAAKVATDGRTIVGATSDNAPWPTHRLTVKLPTRR